MTPFDLRSICDADDCPTRGRYERSAPSRFLTVGTMAGGRTLIRSPSAYSVTVVDCQVKSSASPAHRFGYTPPHGSRIIGVRMGNPAEREQIERHLAAGETGAALEAISAYLSEHAAPRRSADSAWAERKKAQALFMDGAVDQALGAAQRALEYARRSGDATEEAEVENAFGVLYGGKGELVKAVQHLQRSYQLFRGAKSPRMAAVLNNIGNTCLIMDDAERALGYFQKALDAAREDEGQPTIEGTALANIGRALHELGRLNEASDYLMQSVAAFAELEAESLRAHSTAKLAKTLEAAGDIAAAEARYREALESADTRGDESWIYELRGSLALLLMDQDRLDEAEPLLRTALDGVHDHAGSLEAPRWHMVYSAILERRGDTDKALARMRSAFELLERVAEQRVERGLHQAMARLELERIEQENEQYRKENRQLTAALEEVEKLRRELEARNADLSELVVHDPLTSLFNRRWFMERLPVEVERARRYGHALSVAMLDLDHFKEINDRYGHGVGDAVLTKAASVMTANVRSTDSVVRYGGEEFAILMPETTQERAADACEKLRTVFEAADWSAQGVDAQITFSAGVASLSDHDTVDTLIDRADRRLYAAKEDGRNRTVAGGRSSV